MSDENKLTIQLRDILQVELLRDAQVLAGSKGLTNSIVSVNVMEVPDIVEWVRPGEFLLTTAYTFSDDVTALERLIPQLRLKNVCGMGIKTQRYISEVPECVIRLADELDFPIIQIPQNVPYGELIKEIFNHIIGEQTRLLSRINDFNHIVREIMLRHEGMQGIAEQIYLATGAPVVIRDDIFRDSHFYCPDPDKERLIESDYRDLVATDFARPDQKVAKRRSHEVAHGENGVRRFAIPIYFDNMHYGSIFLWDTDGILRPQDLFVIESTSSLIALDILNRTTLVERENVHQTTFLEQLLNNDPVEQAKAIESADYYLFHPNLPSQIVVLIMDHEHDLQKTPNNTKMIKNLNTSLLNLTNLLKKEYEGYFLSTRKSDRVVFLLQFDNECPADGRHALCQRFVETVLKCIEEQDALRDTFIGVGSCVNSYRQLPASLQQAEQTVRILQSRRERDESVLFFDDLGLLRVLGHPLLRDDALAYAGEVLHSLEAHDSKQRGDLLDTIRVYFASGGNLKRVSEILFTHYNTIVYRINRIRDVYGIDLRDPETAFRFQLALKIRELIQ
ncbi:MAG TPA: PucR family transcriptional regulator ligand-binding domain-containing protein [Clostridia bacterium]|nr:PucR family transcriptional regulator ligand-binding domain-containing protein [Clostridia bacterium]